MKKIKCKAPKAPKQRKVRAPKVRAPKMPGAKIGKAIDKLKKASFKATLFCGVALFFATILGRFVIDIPTTTMATWIYGALVGIFCFFFALSFIIFFFWYIPRPIIGLLIAGVLVTIPLILIVYPEGIFDLYGYEGSIPVSLSKTLTAIYTKVKDLLGDVLVMIDSIFA